MDENSKESLEFLGLRLSILSTALEVVTKSLIILFWLFSLLGVFLAINYLNLNGLMSESTNVFSSVPILISLAVFSLSLSFSLVVVFVVFPVIMHFSLNSEEVGLQPNKLDVRVTYLASRGSILVLPICVILGSLSFSTPADLASIAMLIAAFLSAIIICFYCREFSDSKKRFREKAFSFFTVFMVVSVAYFSLILIFAIFIRFVSAVSTDEAFQWVVFFGSIVVYLFFCMLFMSAVDLRRLVVVGLAVGFVLIVMAFPLLSKTSLMFFQIAGFKTTIAVDPRVFSEKDSLKDFKVSFVGVDGRNVAVVTDAWVKLSLPDKVILSASEQSVGVISIPSRFIYAEY